MIVYVETNFILELALEQKHHQAANEILQLAEKRTIELAFPGFSISESLSEVTRKSRERDGFLRSLRKLQEDLERSASYQKRVIVLEPVLALLQEAIRTETDQLLFVLERILKTGLFLELDSSSFSRALAYKDQLSTEDSLVYGTIIFDLKRRPYDESKLFMSSDKEAFDNQRIKTELKSYRCEYTREFKCGLGYIESELRKAE